MNSDELAEKIKAKYPVYASMDNPELVRKVLEEHPVYRSQLTEETEPSNSSMAWEATKGAWATPIPGVSRGVEAVRRDIPNYLSDKGGIPGAMVGTAIGTAGEFLPSTVGEVAAYAVPARFISKGGELAAKGARAVAPNISEAIVAAARRMKIPLTPAELTASPIYSMLQKALSKLPLSSGIMERMNTFRSTQLQAARDALLGKAGKSVETGALGEATKSTVTRTLESQEAQRMSSRQFEREGTRLHITGPYQTESEPAIGSALQEKLSRSESAAKKAAGDLYDKVGKSIKPGFDMQPADELRSTARKILGTRGQAPSTLPVGMRGTLEEITSSPQGLSWQKMHELQSSYGKMAQGEIDPVKKSILIELRNAVRTDMGKLAERMGGKTKQNYDLATAFYADYKNTFANDTIRKALRTNPEDVYNMAVNTNSVTELQRIKKIVGESGIAPLRRRFLDKLVGTSEEGIPNTSQIMHNLSKYKNVLPELLTQDQIKQVQLFAERGKLPQFVESEVQRKLRSVMARTPDQVVHAILGGDTFVARETKKMVGTVAWQGYRRKLMERIIGESGHDIFKAEKIFNDLDSHFEPEYLREFFSPSELNQIRDIGKIHNLIQTSGGQVPMTAKVIGGGAAGAAGFHILETGKVAIFNPVAGAVAGTVILTPPILAKFYLSPLGRRLLTEGLTASEKKWASTLFPAIVQFARNANREVTQENRANRGL